MNKSLQLYSMRDYPDQIELLSQLPEMGITQVEGYGGVYTDPLAYKDAMDKNGISMPSGHIGLADIEGDFNATMEIVKTLGIQQVFAPYLDEKDRPNTTAGYITLAKRLAEAGERFAEHGISFGWHNHDFEFIALADGSIPLEIMLEHSPNLNWEADLAWVIRAGSDPLDYIQRFGSRMTVIHVKDIATAGTNIDEDGWADLGTGTIDWTTLLTACSQQSNNLIYTLEHDKPRDPIGYARRSAKMFDTLWEKTNG
jgi:sugar phosphate isomerase/epimerase